MVTATATRKRISVSRIHGQFFPSIKRGFRHFWRLYAREDLGFFQEHGPGTRARILWILSIEPPAPHALLPHFAPYPHAHAHAHTRGSEQI